MNRALVIGLAVAVTAVTAVMVYSYLDDSNHNEVTTDPVGEIAVDNAINGFGWNMFDTLDGSSFFSPYGIYTALGMLANGAEPGSATEKEIMRILNSTDSSKVNEDVMKVLEALGPDVEGREFGSSNLILVDSTLLANPNVSINGDFSDIIEKYYDGTISEADFRNNCDAVKEMITKWVDDRTKGFIPDYKSIADASTVTDLLNVVYFKGDWEYKFDAENTDDDDFTDSSGNVSAVPMMCKKITGSLKYYADDKYRGIELPYKMDGEDIILAMYIVIPLDGGNGCIDSWKKESPEYREGFIEKIRGSDGYRDIRIHLPKFEMEKELDLQKILMKMGMTISFSGSAEYTKILDGTDLVVGGAKHQAKIKVDEEGTEAAAVTEIILEKAALPSNPFMEFYCNIPFVFTISEMTTGTNLFMGCYDGPSNVD